MRLNLIQIKVDRKNKRLYTCDQMGVRDQELLGLLRQEVPFKIIMHLLFNSHCSRDELAKDLKLHPPTIYYHIKKLLELDLITPVEIKEGKFISWQEHKPTVFIKPVGREKFYMLKNREIAHDLDRLLVTHRDSMIDPNIIDIYREFTEEWKDGRGICGPKKPKKLFSFNLMIDNLMETVDEICYFPFRF
jgi:DNA-binding transcriptional ArsR family regulator